MHRCMHAWRVAESQVGGFKDIWGWWGFGFNGGRWGEKGGGWWFGPRAMTSLCAHVILLRWSPISRDSRLSRMGREGRSNPGDSGSHSPKERERERKGGAREGACIQGWIVPEMGQIKKTRNERNRLTLGRGGHFWRWRSHFPLTSSTRKAACRLNEL